MSSARRPLSSISIAITLIVSASTSACVDDADDPLARATPAPYTHARADAPRRDGRTRDDATSEASFVAYPGKLPADYLTNPPACSPEDWLAKYMTYRQRFRGARSAGIPGFVSFGTAPGEGLPSGARHPDERCASSWYIQSHGCGYDDWQHAQGTYGWGDTTIWLGTWIAVLASEHEVFTRLGLDTTETRSDLYYALTAFNRLDALAEVDFGKPPALDGFFRRDDVPEDFYRLPDGSPRFPRADLPNGRYGCVAATCDPPEVSGGSYVSGDQVIGMLLGTALVAELVPAGATFGGLDLQHEARAITHRIVEHLVGNGYHVRAPDGTTPPNEWGGNVTAFGHEIGEVANAICGDDFGVDDYATVVGMWALADASWYVQSGINQSMMMKLAALTAAWSPDTMAWKAAERRAEVFPYIQAVVHGEPVGEHMAGFIMESLLTSAPCGGPCKDTRGCSETHGWRGPDRVNSGEYREGSFYGIGGEFNGLDYMLMHNFYFLAEGGRYDVRPAPRPAGSCAGHTSLDQLRERGDLSRFDPAHACAVPDLERRFCGRSFARWIDAAQRGEVTLWTRGRRWRCTPGAACELVADRRGHSDGADLILGSSAPDRLRGAGGSDCLYGFGGDDDLAGGRAFDELHGGDGDDTLRGEGAFGYLEGESDILWGDAGDDRLYGNQGNDDLYGGDGDDLLDAGNGHDALDGGPGNDRLDGGARSDTMLGGPGHDVIDGGLDPDRIEAGDGDDVIYGGTGDDRIYTGEGTNRVEAGAGRDFIAGGSGDDTIECGPGDDTEVWAGGGRNVVYGGDGDDVLYGGDDRDVIDGNAGRDALFGGGGGDLLRGGLGADTLNGGDGDDRLCGNENNDTLDGGGGQDACRGGWGNDQIDRCTAPEPTLDQCEPGAFDAW